MPMHADTFLNGFFYLGLFPLGNATSAIFAQSVCMIICSDIFHKHISGMIFRQSSVYIFNPEHSYL